MIAAAETQKMEKLEISKTERKGTEVGRLYCQRNSMAKTIETVVLSCVQSDASAEALTEFEVELEDTVIFPTGGGQPHDTGIIKILVDDGHGTKAKVLRCERRGMKAIHFIDQAIPPGSMVEVTVDWVRRWDQMQQHSAQHIVSDVAERIFTPPWITYCWNMGPLKSFIEFKDISPNQAQLDELEKEVNDFILAAHPMVLEESVLQVESAATERPDSLPSDIQSGVIRIVRFGDFSGPCCGTHVSNSANGMSFPFCMYLDKH